MALPPRMLTLLPLGAALAGCGGGTASAQTPAPPDDGLAHAYMYEVSAEHAAALSGAARQEASPFIEVSGAATVAVRPDRVHAAFAVESRAANAADASAANAAIMDRVVGALRQSGIPGLEIETFGYTLRPEYSWSEPARVRVIDGYTALNHIRVRATDVAAAGRLLDTAIRAGANRVSSLAFEASDTGPAREEALAAAVLSATAQARTMARALGRSLGAPLEVRGGAQLPAPRFGPEMAMAMAREDVETPVEAGDLTVSAAVTIRFALGGRVEER